ncbi:Kinase, NEK [Giardia muris]|uniref:Kinase, NEK n=1 Tax=Giardia muris TaxID=5742 RepID=A0A4Z1SMR2_GIAMU|nr:Kinase, NEK [Giardia muris]|eukprot:TNJ26986.1 Kinase, NEK [Giardia muris]
MSDTALMEAARNGDLDDVKRNLNQVGKQGGYGETALIRAAINGHANCIPLLEKEIGMQNNWGWTALMLAALTGNADCVRLLLSEAGKQTTKEWYDFPPGTAALMMAAHQNHPEVVKLLLPHEQGLKDSKGHSAQWHANNSSWGGNFTRVRKLLKNEGSKRAPPPPKESVFLHICTVAGDVEGVRKYVSHAGYQDSNGMTALMLAAEKGYAECILLLEEEAGMQDKGGWTALMHAAYNGHSNCIPLLKEEVEKKNNSGQTALMKAAECGQTKCIPLLEKEIGKQDSSGWTALMFAAFYGKTDCIRHLLSETGKQTTKNCNGFPPGATALMLAARRNHPKIVELLLPYEQGLKDSKEHTAKQYAKKKKKGNSTRIIQLLEKEGTERIPPPSPGLTSQERINKLTAENESLKKELSQPEGKTSSLENPPTRTEESLISSAIQGDLNTLRRHLDQAGQKDSSGMTALMHAASRGQTEVVRLLRPLEARLQDGRGWTALMHAVRGGHEECVGLLLLERDLKDREGRTAEDVANGLPDGKKKKITPLLRKKVQLPDLPDELSSFQLTGRLGRGTFGTVFSAWSEEHGNCALKVVEYEEMERTIVDSLRREMGTIPSLEHPHVLRYHRVHDDPDKGTAYLVMEWCSGTLLDEVRGRGERGEPFRDEEVWRCLREMASGLAYLHEKRYVHRDLKPENVLLSYYGFIGLGVLICDTRHVPVA